ncbi:tellurium resistance protein [Streptomyces gardneri]|uniref:tellurium resistance protein n=1 Tax=Streptomyces gardneri TaxID=66892 RepID=UPI0036962034
MSDDRRRGVIRLKPATGDRPVRPPAEERAKRPPENTPVRPPERTPARPPEATPARPPERTPARPPERTPARPSGKTPARRTDTLLTKAAPRGLVAGRGVLQANLNWSASTGADLDLGCLVELADGSREAVQALGNTFGSLTAPPYVQLDQDDRSGASSDGETLRTHLEYRSRIRRLLVYTYVYEGAVDFRSLGAAVTVTAPSASFRILLDDAPQGATACAIALIDSGEGGLSVRREVRWFTPAHGLSNQQLIDQAYGFGLEWVWATKD